MNRARPASDGPVPNGAWYLLSILIASYVLSYVDRYSLALLIGGISRDIRLTDAQMGLLVGAGFAILYSIAGMPVAWFLDTRKRRNVIAIGILVWSLATIGSAFAASFWALLVLRSMVATGEAVLTPGAMSIIGDTFPAHRRALPIAIYSTVSSVMATGSYVLIAAALALATSLTVHVGWAPWRITLGLLGLPGVALALLLLTTTREPPRVAARGAIAAGVENREFHRFLRSHWRLFLAFFVYLGLFTTVVMANAVWMPAVLVRRFGYSAENAGFLFGSLTIPGALVGIAIWSALGARVLRQGGGIEGLRKLLMTGVIVTAPCVIVAPLAFDLPSCLVASVLAPIGIATGSVTTALFVQEVAPGHMRARLFALSLLSANLVGMTLGPVAAPLLVSALSLDGQSIGVGVATLASICLLLAAGALGIFRTAFRQPVHNAAAAAI